MRKHAKYKMTRFESLFNDAKRRHKVRKYLELSRSATASNTHKRKGTLLSGNKVDYTKENKQMKMKLERIKENSYKKIFAMLDFDRNGFISAKDVELSRNLITNQIALPHHILQIIQPLLNSLRKEPDYNDFIEQLNALYKTMTVDEKKIILGYAKECSVENQYELHYNVELLLIYRLYLFISLRKLII